MRYFQTVLEQNTPKQFSVVIQKFVPTMPKTLTNQRALKLSGQVSKDNERNTQIHKTLTSESAIRKYNQISDRNKQNEGEAFCGTNTAGYYRNQLHERPSHNYRMGQCGQIKDSSRFYCCPQCA